MFCIVGGGETSCKVSAEREDAIVEMLLSVKETRGAKYYQVKFPEVL